MCRYVIRYLIIHYERSDSSNRSTELLGYTFAFQHVPSNTNSKHLADDTGEKAGQGRQKGQRAAHMLARTGTTRTQQLVTASALRDLHREQINHSNRLNLSLLL